jgi:hypothetical protein
MFLTFRERDLKFGEDFGGLGLRMEVSWDVNLWPYVSRKQLDPTTQLHIGEVLNPSLLESHFQRRCKPTILTSGAIVLSAHTTCSEGNEPIWEHAVRLRIQHYITKSPTAIFRSRGKSHSKTVFKWTVHFACKQAVNGEARYIRV